MGSPDGRGFLYLPMTTYPGLVQQTRGGVYSILLDEGGRLEASLRGRLKQEARVGDRVVIGDRVTLERGEDGSFTIEEVLPRERQLVRCGPSGRAKVVAANLDRLLVVIAAAEPDPHPELIDRLLVIGEDADMEPWLVINKMDLPEAHRIAAPLADLYREVGYGVTLVSALGDEGIEEIRELLCSGSVALIGPSGAGKSTILNRAQPNLELRTGELSHKKRTGRHTTVSARLILLECGGLVADTPGFGDVGLWEVRPDELDQCFPEFRRRIGRCRFRGCRHDHEPSCAVKEAVAADEIPKSRYQSYLRLLGEAGG